MRGSPGIVGGGRWDKSRVGSSGGQSWPSGHRLLVQPSLTLVSSSLGPSPSSTVCRDAPPPPSPLKAIGKFHHLIQTGQVQTAFDTMVVHMLLPMFLKVGEAPNVSTTTCCAWIFDQVTSPMIEILRCEGEGRDISEALSHGLALVQSCIGAARHSFHGDPHLAHVSLFFESLCVLMESAQGEISDGGLAHTPSALRAALEKVRSTFGPDSALGLAFEHGVLGQALLEASSRLIASNAQDAAAFDKFSKAQALVAKLSDASGGQDGGGEEVIDVAAIDEVVRSTVSAVGMWGTSEKDPSGAGALRAAGGHGARRWGRRQARVDHDERDAR